MNKVIASAAEAVADVPDGASLALSGVPGSGVPGALIQALFASGVSACRGRRRAGRRRVHRPL
ncbi:CoA-transferase, partial [Streptomyces sp. NPDC005921]